MRRIGQIDERYSAVAQLRGEIDSRIGPLVDDRPYALVDFPNYPNVGDSAIWLGAKSFLSRAGEPNRVAMMGEFDGFDFDGPIWIIGGGNFGDLWPRHQDYREGLLERFPGRQIIQLPQSIHYDDLANVDRTARAIERHGAFVLCVRDEASRAFAERHFDCRVILAPDMALYLGDLTRRGRPRCPVLALARDDKERAGAEPHDFGRGVETVDWLSEPFGLSQDFVGSRTRKADRLREDLKVRFYDVLAASRLRYGQSLLSRGEVVATDRLHAHLLALLMGIPHVVADNSTGKISGLMSVWTGGLPGVHSAASLAEAVAAAMSLAEAKGGRASLGVTQPSIR